jgi:DNA-binding MarR family transcriptional regulator
MARARTGVLLIPEEHLEKHRRDFDADFDPITSQTLFALRALAQRVNDQCSGWLAPLGLTARQYNYLAVVYAEGSVTPNVIGSRIHTANPTVTSMLDALERDGLVSRRENPADKRSFVVELTQRGRALYRRAFRLHHQNLSRIMRGFSREERRQLLDLLLKLGDAFATPVAEVDATPVP